MCHRLLAVFVALLALITTACPPSAPPPPPPPPSDAELAIAYGAAIDRCAPLPDDAFIYRLEPESRNGSSGVRLGLLLASSMGNGFSIDAADASACIAALAVVPCDSDTGFLARFPNSCSSMFRGPLDNGAVCASGFECASGLCSSECGQCVATLFVGAGESCASAPCDDRSQCGVTGPGAPAECLPIVGEGDACDAGHLCDAGQRCLSSGDGAVCVRAPGLGEACTVRVGDVTTDISCENGGPCDDGICGAPPLAGDRCVAGSCDAATAQCDAIGANCLALGAEDEACGVVGCLPGLVCDANVCRKNPAGFRVGDPCVLSADACGGNILIAGLVCTGTPSTCVAADVVELGDACDTPGEFTNTGGVHFCVNSLTTTTCAVSPEEEIGVCVTLPSAGDTCGPRGECALGAVCDPTNDECVVLPRLDEPCVADTCHVLQGLACGGGECVSACE